MAKNDSQTVTKETTTETRPVEDQAVSPKKEHRMTVAERIIYLVGGIILALLALRFLLLLFGANPDAGFADFIYTLSYPFAAPFFGLFNYQLDYGQSVIEMASIMGIIVYGILMVILARIATIGSRRADR